VAEISVLGQLEGFLQVARKRATVIASNMANIDTPGYHTKDLDFSRELARATAAADNLDPHATTPRISDVQGLMERPDGNNVDVDRESMLLAQTQLQYQAGTQLLKSQFHNLLTAINSNGS
jgi:flagellar basal-body rod protein FlgB